MFAGFLMLALGAPPPMEAEPLPPRVSEARKDALARFGAGLWQARRERLLTAAKSLEAAAKLDPDSTAALKELITVYAQIGREPDAIRIARTVLEKDPHDVDTIHTLARLLFDAGEVGEALSFAKEAAERIESTSRPEKALAIYRDLAALQDRNGNTTGAVEAWKLATDMLTTRRKAIIALAAFTPQEIDTEAADAFERLGKALVKDRKPDAAAAAFLAAYKLYTDPLRANDRSAAARLEWNLSAAYAEKNPATALAHLEDFLKLRPQAIEPYERLVSLLNSTGRGDEIVPALQKHAAKEPGNLPLHAVLAAEQARKVETRHLADAGFTKLLAETNDPKIVRLALRSYIQSERAGKIIDELDSAYKGVRDDGKQSAEARAFAADKARTILDVLRVEPDWSDAVLRSSAGDLRGGINRQYQTFSALGYLAARHRKLDFAVIQYGEAVINAPLNAQGEIYLQMIALLSQGHKNAELAKVCRDALKRDDLIRLYPLYSAFFHRNLALALARLGEEKDAIASADKAISQGGDIDRLGFRLAKVDVLGSLERWDDAIQLCTKLQEEFPGQADRLRVRYVLSMIYSGAKKKKEAEAELRGILDIDPDHKGACNNLGYQLADEGRNLDEAERLVRRAIAVDRVDRRKSGEFDLENASFLDSLAWVLFRRERLAEARTMLEKVAAMPDGANDGVVWDHLGDVRFRLGDKDKARTAWEEAGRLLAVDPRGKREGRLDEVKRKLKRLP